jgi:hypothetical protein
MAAAGPGAPGRDPKCHNRARTQKKELAMRLALALLVLVPGAAALASDLDLARAQVVDLTHAFDESTLYWPTAPSRFQLNVLHHGPTPAG